MIDCSSLPSTFVAQSQSTEEIPSTEAPLTFVGENS